MYEEFYELFNIPKIEYKQPGRTVDDNNEICEYYIDYQYPPTEPVFFELLNYYNTCLWGKLFNVQDITEFSLCNTLRENIVKRILELSKTQDTSEELQDIYDIFNDYYNLRGETNGN